MNVNIIDSMSSWISYGKNNVDLARWVLESVPVEMQEELKSLAIKACEDYHKIVQDKKTKGEKVSPASIKKETMDTLKAWVKRNQVSELETVVRATKPRIPKNNETPRVVQKQSYFSNVDVSETEIENMFNNFDSENLLDEAIVINDNEVSNIELDEDLFNDGDLLEGLDDF